MPHELEVGPGETFLIADHTMLVRETQSLLAKTSLIGDPDSQMSFLITYTGRINRTEDIESWTIAISPPDMLDFINTALDQLELLKNAIQADNEENPDA